MKTAEKQGEGGACEAKPKKKRYRERETRYEGIGRHREEHVSLKLARKGERYRA